MLQLLWIKEHGPYSFAWRQILSLLTSFSVFFFMDALCQTNTALKSQTLSMMLSMGIPYETSGKNTFSQCLRKSKIFFALECEISHQTSCQWKNGGILHSPVIPPEKHINKKFGSSLSLPRMASLQALLLGCLWHLLRLRKLYFPCGLLTKMPIIDRIISMTISWTNHFMFSFLQQPAVGFIISSLPLKQDFFLSGAIAVQGRKLWKLGF